MAEGHHRDGAAAAVAAAAAAAAAAGPGTSTGGGATAAGDRRPISVARLKEKGKKAASAFVLRELAVEGRSDSLHRLLDDLLWPERLISNSETIEWCRWLVAGGRTPAEFASIVRAYDNHAKCGLVWIPHVVAYRCRTCGISPCMSICRDCFKRGNHENHDFNMFLSQAGGACDCGDTSVMKAEGFCSDHGISNCQAKAPVPADLMLVAEAMMPRLILRILLHFREYSNPQRTVRGTPEVTAEETAEYCSDYCAMLMEFNNMGELMRRVMTKTLIDRNVYRRLLDQPFPTNYYGHLLRESCRKYDEALRRFPSPEPPPDYRHLPALGRTIVHETLLEEFIFWTFKYEFQQQIVCFLLNMLPDQDYKEHLTRTFVMHYCRIPSVLELSSDPDTLSNRVVHMSVQLFSNESLALKMVEELSLLHVMIISLRQMMSKILTPHTLHDPARNFHYVVDCARPVMKEHCYWPLVSDFNNVLSHESVALVFLKDDDLIDMWFQFLSMLQGMNVNIREIISHVEYESSSYYAAFSCELEASAYPMWSIISHLRDPSHAPLAKKIMLYCVNYLQDWLDAVNFTQHPKFEKDEMTRASFHFPLHRYLAAFICQGVKTMGMSLNDILPSADLLPMLMMHPLRVQSLFYEILSGVWVRNGLQIKGQAMTYIQANFCNSMVDMDMFFLQICATQLPPNHFLGECIAIFGVEDWLGMSLVNASPEMELDSMLEGLLTFLATLITSRINLGNDETTQCIIEISALLATGDKTHSQLLELMPERSGNAHTRNFERYLKELSIYRSPPVGSENLEQGLFMPVAAVWEQHYDPLHVLLRAVHRRDFQNSLDRFGAYVKQAGKMPRSGTLWPPFRLPSPCGPAYSDPGAVLGSRILHATILVIFYRAVHTHSVSEHMLALAVFLLEMAVGAAAAVGGEATTSSTTVGDSGTGGGPPGSKEGHPLAAGGAACDANAHEPTVPDLLNCYPSNCLSDNLRMVVHRITLMPATRRSPVSYHKPLDSGSSPPYDSDVEWDLSEDETLMMIGSSADTVEGGPGGVGSGSEVVVAAAAAPGSSDPSAHSTALVPVIDGGGAGAGGTLVNAGSAAGSTATQMVVEEEEDDEQEEGVDGEDQEDDEEGEEGEEEDDSDSDSVETRRMRQVWRQRYRIRRRRRQEAPVPESQDEDMRYQEMDDDFFEDADQNVVYVGNMRTSSVQELQEHLSMASARQREQRRQIMVQMMEDFERRRISNAGNANVVQLSDVDDFAHDDEDEDEAEEEEEDDATTGEGVEEPHETGEPTDGQRQELAAGGNGDQQPAVVAIVRNDGTPRVRAARRNRRQEMAVPMRALTPPAGVVRAMAAGIMPPAGSLRLMYNAATADGGAGGGAGGLAVVHQQQHQLQSYYAPPAGTGNHLHHHHHHHHHHRHHHHHNHHTEAGAAESLGAMRGRGRGGTAGALVRGHPQTPRHYRSVQAVGGGPVQAAGSAATGVVGRGPQHFPWIFPRHNVAGGRHRNTAGTASETQTTAVGAVTTTTTTTNTTAAMAVVAAATTTAVTMVSPAAAMAAATTVKATGSEVTPRDSGAGRSGLAGVEGGSGCPGTGQGRASCATNSTVVLEESIISLLLKLHLQLSGAQECFSLDEEEEDVGGGSAQPSTSAGASSSTSNTCNRPQMMELDEEDAGSSARGCSSQPRGPRRAAVPESRIGDGPYFIGNLLRKIAALDERCAARIGEIRQQLWPNQRERQAEQKAREAREKEERTRRAKERQKKMMEEFANRQKRFMQIAMEAGGDLSGMDASSSSCAAPQSESEAASSLRQREERQRQQQQQAEAEAMRLREKEYTCIICNTSGPSTESNPIGLVVLVESSSVVGHRRTRAERLPLPLSADDRAALEQSTTLAGEFNRRIELLQWKFGQTSWFLSHNIGCEGGVHIQSCGHHVHLSCQDAYMRSLNTPRSPNNLNVERGEFFCPVCRQLANSVLPLSPALDGPAPLIRSPTPPHRTLALELIGLFQESKRTPKASKFTEAMRRAMGNITTCTQRNIMRYPVTLQSLFSFVVSIARTNLEAEVIQRGGSLCTTDDVRYKPKRECIVPLLHVLSLHVRLMINDDWPIRFKVGDDWPWHSWSRLAGIQLAYGIDEPRSAAASSVDEPVELDAQSVVRAGPSPQDSLEGLDLALAVVPASKGRRRPQHSDDEDDDNDDDDDDNDDDEENEPGPGDTDNGVLRGFRRVASSIRGMLLPPPRGFGDDELPTAPIATTTASSTVTSTATTTTMMETGAGSIASGPTTTAAAASTIIDTETIPDLISDPTALMLKFILFAPLHLDQAYFTCIVKAMYNLLYYQIVLQLCTHLTDDECDEILGRYGQQPTRVVRERGVPHIGAAMALVLRHLDRCRHIRSDSILMGAGSSSGDAGSGDGGSTTTSMEFGGTDTTTTTTASSSSSSSGKHSERINLDLLEKKLQRLCLPFLRIAALLRHHIYHAEIPDIAGPQLEFARLVYFLELVTVSMDWDKFNASRALCFLPGTELALPKNWCDQLRNLRPSYESTRSLIVRQHIEWRQPRLLGLPREYERLFTYYHELPCQKCKNVPKESSICLLCGTIVCIKQTCCKEQECCEAVRHAISCGGGTGIFLVITSTYIIVIRGQRACLWGSLYLDDYDEEDRDLKRGKPLYLSEDRFNLLESQWLSHRFAHTKHNWVWHRDSL